MPALAKEPMLQLPCSPDIRTRRPLRSTAMACVFIATSRVPWNAPQTNSAANNADRLPVSLTSGRGCAVADERDLHGSRLPTLGTARTRRSSR